MTPEQLEAGLARQLHLEFLRKWTDNGKHLITSAGGNFWMRGGNRNRCCIFVPQQLAALVRAGVLRKVAGGYQFVKENH